MFKIAGNVFDCYDDPKFMGHVDVSKYLGSELIEPGDLTKLADDAFAAKIIGGGRPARRFPVYNEWITKVSCLYFLASENTFPDELKKVAGANLAAACAKYNLGAPAEIAKYASKDVTSNVVKIVKVAAKEPEATTEDELGKLLAKRAEFDLIKMTPEDRVLLAAEMDKLGAAQYSREIYDYVPKYGPNLERGVYDRMCLLKAADDNTSGYLMSTLKALYDSRTDKDPLVFATELANFDKHAGIRARYKSGFTDAYKTTFGGSKKGPVEHGQFSSGEAEPPATHKGEEAVKEATEMSVAAHLNAIAEEYPKHSIKYAGAMIKKAGDKWGASFKAAWNKYFGHQ